MNRTATFASWMTCPACGRQGRYDHEGEWRHRLTKAWRRNPDCQRESKKPLDLTSGI